MRSLGIDLGSKRIGVAVSDLTGLIASPLTVLGRTARRADDHQNIQDLVTEYEAECVVVGMPFSLNGKMGPAAINVKGEVEQLKLVVKVPVYTHDERLTTKSAHDAMRIGNVKSTKRREMVDKIAAAVMLQGWLDHADRQK